ncbi:transglutaminase TgpA family protein [Cohnella soli]|uniref:DUF3488 and DUF4129 domain-containing transglutaminase family protein n=1 Tax=Cohnella soli TaxID=425005 RepID=A0ABW0HXW1_9BACL
MKLLGNARFWRSLFLERLHRLLAVAIVVQLIQCFSDTWWEETYAIIYGMLGVTAITELLFTRLLGLRLLVQIAALIGFTIWKMEVTWGGWPLSWRSWTEIERFVTFHSDQFHPFFELGIGTLALVHVFSWVGSRRAGAVLVIVMSIGLMAAIDSFYPLELWHNIAWIVVAGLAWLVVIHLRQLQERHPESWESLAQRPLDIAFPAVLVITLVLLSGIFMPRAPVVLQDPYTMWSESQGKAVTALPGEGGIQKINIESSSKKGSSLSGYSRDDRKIGGSFQFDYSPVMTVTTTQASYWRGETKAIYNGKGWADTKQPTLVPLPVGGDAKMKTVPERSPEAKTKEVVQTVKMERKDKLPVLFGAGSISAVSELKSDNNAGLRWNAVEGEARWNKSARVESYTLVSEVTVLDEQGLRQAPAPSSEYDFSPYLQLPETLPQRVRDLAAEKTADATNSYDKAKKLEEFLKTTFPYTNTPDLTKMTNRANSDFVDAFLFEIQEGYCDYFSTSFVVMARSIGLPTRWVKGYSTGNDVQASERARFMDRLEDRDPTRSGTYTVRNADAHSWAEVYFEGYGWIPFEPTSGFSVPQPLPEGETITPDPSTDTETTPVDTKVATNDNNWFVVGAAIGVSLVLAIAAVFLYRSRRAHQLWERIRTRGHSPSQRAAREMEKLLSFLQRKGLRREQHETIRETFNRWGDRFGSLRAEFDGAIVSFEKVRYGQESGDSVQLNEFTAAAEKIRKGF